jgi:hypothetical protein
MKKIGIAELLIWAFCDELPKAGMIEGSGPFMASSSGAYAEMSVLGTLVDRSPNAFGVLPLFAYEGEPHRDATIVGEAVRELRSRNFEVAVGWNPFPDWPDEHGLVAAEVERVVSDLISARNPRLNGQQIVALVTSCAILKRGPDWSGSQPKTIVCSNNGKDPSWFVKRSMMNSLGRMEMREVDGFDYRKRRPAKDAYNKHRLEGSIVSAVMSRLDWQIWQSSLEALHEVLDDRLTGHDLLPFNPDRAPWARTGRSQTKIQAIENVM